MADAREQGVWSEHARLDHTKAEPYTYSKEIDSLLENTYPNGIKLVMDVGCGSGLWRRIFSEYDYVGVDQNEDMINLALKRNFIDIPKSTRFLIGNARKLSDVWIRCKQKPDLIFCSAVLQHNRHEPDKREVVEEINRTLRPHGYFLFTENTFAPHNFNPPFNRFQEGQTDGWSFTQKGWEDFMNLCGFTLIKNDPFNFYLFQKED